MNAPSSRTCPKCGAALPADAPHGLCPRCLVGMNFASQSGAVGDGSVAPPPPIEELAPHFPQLELLECLGRGGMGVVYKARQPKLNRLVALKILAPERERDPAFAERFTHEARALARLSHPNIVTVHDFGVARRGDIPVAPAHADGDRNVAAPCLFYLLMEFVDGVNLRELLNAGRISAREALAIVPQICDALQYAHDAGIVHRDIKPENILLDRRGRVKVADFGLAKLVGAPLSSDTSDRSYLSGHEGSTQAGQVLGTPHYMAPEQVEHPSDVDHRADIYSLGVVFYQMLTGELPKGDFAPPSRKVVIDVRLDEVVLRALEKRPEHRYQHVSDVRTMCETIAANPPPAIPPQAPVGTAGAPVREKPDLLSELLLFSPIVGVRNGRRVIHWAGWRSNGILSMGVMALVCVPAVLSGEHISGWLVSLFLFTLGMIVAGAVRDCRKPIEQFPPLDNKAVSKNPPTLAVFASLYLALVVTLMVSGSTLPDRVACHFGLNGNADDWMGRVPYLLLIGAIPAVMALLFAFVSRRIRTAGASFITIPRRDYWLAPERRDTTSALLRDRLTWLLCLLTLFFGSLHVLTVAANRTSPPLLNMGALLVVVIVFLVALMMWLFMLVMRFAEADDRGDRTAPQLPIIGKDGGANFQSLEKSPPPGALRRAVNRRLKMSFLVSVALAVFVVAPIIQIFFVHSFVAASDAAAPEIPRGSRVIVWKQAHAFAPGDLIAYRCAGDFCLGRVASAEVGNLIVRRNHEPDTAVPRGDVVGKVITVLWRGSNVAAPNAEQYLSFGPVIERTIALGNTSNSFYSVNRGGFVPGPREFTPLPEPDDTSDDARSMESNLCKWMTDHDVDFIVRRNHGAPVLTLAGMLSFQVDAADFEKRTAHNLLHDPAFHELADKQLRPDYASPLTGDIHGGNKTLAFQTRYERTGLVQVLGVSSDPPSVTIRYKLVQGGATNALAVVRPAPADGRLYFGSVVTNYLPFCEGKKTLAFQFRGGGTGFWLDKKTNVAEQVTETKKFREQIAEAGGDDIEAVVTAHAFEIIGTHCSFTARQTPEWLEQKRRTFVTAKSADLSTMQFPDWDKQTADDIAGQFEMPTWTTAHFAGTKAQLPVTLLFKAEHGEMGILQLLDIIDMMSGTGPGYGLSIRYKLVEGGETQSAVVTKPAPAAVFGLQAERTLAATDGNLDGVVAFRFQNNEVVKPPVAVTGHFKDPAKLGFTPELRRWMQDENVDLLLYLGEKSYYVLSLNIRSGWAGQPKEWDTILPDCAAPQLTKMEKLNSEPTGPSIMGECGYRDGLGVVQVFRTRDGLVGFFQLRGLSDADGRGVNIRYKLVQAGATKAGTAVEAGPGDVPANAAR